jgi:hypothetical protein
MLQLLSFSGINSFAGPVVVGNKEWFYKQEKARITTKILYH